jgi:FkbM family methyltransferase
MKTLAVEPDKRNQRVLKIRYEKNKNFILIPNALSAKTQNQVTFYVHQSGSALNTLSKKWTSVLDHSPHPFKVSYDWKTVKVDTTTLPKLIKDFGCPCFVKLDVEGHELAVIQALTEPLPLIMFEANLPEFYEESKRSIDHLSSIDPQCRFAILQTYGEIEKIQLHAMQTKIRLDGIKGYR